MSIGWGQQQSRSPFGHVAVKEMGQRRERRDVELEHASRKLPRRPYPALFTKIATDLASRLLFQAARRTTRGKIDRLYRCLDSVIPAKIRGSRFDLLGGMLVPVLRKPVTTVVIT